MYELIIKTGSCSYVPSIFVWQAQLIRSDFSSLLFIVLFPFYFPDFLLIFFFVELDHILSLLKFIFFDEKKIADFDLWVPIQVARDRNV